MLEIKVRIVNSREQRTKRTRITHVTRSRTSFEHTPVITRVHRGVGPKQGGSRAYVPNFSGGDLRPPLEKYPRAHLPVEVTNTPTPTYPPLILTYRWVRLGPPNLLVELLDVR
jgi:hypothetical protein